MRLSVILSALFFIAALCLFAGTVYLHQPEKKPPPAKPKRPPAVVQFKEFSLPALPPVPEAPKPKAVVLSSVPFGPPAAVKTPLPVRPPVTGTPRIVIIIDDMGIDVKRSKAVMALKAPLTLAFLPYAPQVAKLAEEAKAGGHELLIHMPMEPMDPSLDMGSIALRHGMKPEEFDAMLDKAFASFGGYAGMNNHMGSSLTQEPEAMEHVMKALAARGLFFVDSRTSAQTVAAREAAKAGVAYASRDVFLDDDPSYAPVLKSLRETEKIAGRTGLAVAIGHPKDATIAALKDWLPQVKKDGFEIVPVSEAVIKADHVIDAARMPPSP